MNKDFLDNWHIVSWLLGALLVVAFVGVLLILFMGAVPGPAPSKEVALCSDEPHINDQVNKIAFEALDNALRDQIQRLFSTWMSDNSGQPARAAVGVRNAAFAYVHARTAILEWNIPPCKPEEHK